MDLFGNSGGPTSPFGVVPKGRDFNNPRREPGERRNNEPPPQRGVTKREVAPRWGLKIMGLVFPRLTPGVIDILSLRDLGGLAK